MNKRDKLIYTYRGKEFNSRGEGERYFELKAMEKDKQISNLKYHPVFEVLPKQDGERAVTYTADSSYKKDGEYIVEDVRKQNQFTDLYILKRKLMLYMKKIKINQIITDLWCYKGDN